jgi:septal ring factor EnvC (AmiA/AmiB activator)
MFEGVDFCLQEEKRILAASRDNLERLYRDSSNSLTILERSHRFTMEELDHQRCKLQESMDEVTRLKQLISAKDATIKELRVSKKSIAQELETAQLAAKVAEETSATLRAQRDRAMDKAIRAGRILMRRPGVVVPEDICHTRVLGVQSPGANIITRCAGTKSHTYDESWHRIECHIFTI